jgi:NADH:ubiquinone oxidoreductase subunit 6 (subunit J)
VAKSQQNARYGGQEAAMSSLEEKHESGSVLIIIGWVLMLFAFLVMFYHPAAVKLGDVRIDVIAVCLAGLGLLLRSFGVRVKSRNR